MDLQFWIWLIVIVITLIARSNKKKPQQYDEPQGNFPPMDKAPQDKPISFEDLLREIQEAKSPKPVRKIEQPKPFTEVDYDENLDEEEQSLETKREEKSTLNYNDDEIYDTYEKAKREAFNKPSLEETLSLEKTDVRFNQFKEYSKTKTKSLAGQYAAELKNPDSVKKAIILNEILNRRF